MGLEGADGAGLRHLQHVAQFRQEPLIGAPFAALGRALAFDERGDNRFMCQLSFRGGPRTSPFR